MTYALIDNATLTGVQRLCGDIKIRSGDIIDADVAAIENMVQAILFYDDLLCIDDYKEEFREQRKEYFPYIRFIDPSKFNLSDIESTAAKESSKFVPEIRGGQFVDEDFNHFLDLLKMNVICTWDVSSSVYYLTLKMLGDPKSESFDKYGVLSAAILSELGETYQTPGPEPQKPLLYDSKGNRITKGYTIKKAKLGGGETGGLTGALSSFVASLSWIAFKSIYYALAASYLKADNFLYPVRQAFQLHYMQKSHVYSADFTSSIISRMNQTFSKDLVKIISSDRNLAYSMELPIFSAWLVLETRNVKDVIDYAFEIRDEKIIQDARGQLREIRNLYDSENFPTVSKKISKILKDVEKICSELLEQYGIESAQGMQSTRLMQVYNTFAAVKGLPTLPEYKFGVKLPTFLKDIIQPKGFGSLYRSIGKELTNFWSLGEARTLLGESVVLDETKASYNPKTELPEYMHAYSWWKCPM